MADPQPYELYAVHYAHNANAKLAVYPLKIENGDVLVEL